MDADESAFFSQLATIIRQNIISGDGTCLWSQIITLFENLK
jgi:hypothetical protein